MDIQDSLFSPSSVLNEQVARQIFDILPEPGPIVAIMDKEGHFWPSNSERFFELDINETCLRGLCDKVDDGVEPVVTQVNDCSIIAAQIAMEQTDCGYVIIALPQYTPESTLINIGLIEILLNQTGLIARLIEKNSQLRELHTKQLSSYKQGEIASS